jgi:hypothetical protein
MAPLLSKDERFCVAAVWCCHSVGSVPDFRQPHLAALKATAESLVERNILIRTGQGYSLENLDGGWEGKWGEAIFYEDGYTFSGMSKYLGGSRPEPRRHSQLQFCMSRRQLERALQDLNEAASGGFTESLAICSVTEVGTCIDECFAEPSGSVILRAPGGLDFGNCDTPGEVVLRGGECVYREELEDEDDADV